MPPKKISVRRYLVRCTTDNKWEEVWGTEEPTACPTDGGHTIDSALTHFDMESDDARPVNEDGVPLSTPQYITVGHQMCDRDIRLVTAELDASFEDIKPVLHPGAGQYKYERVGWDEVVLENVYKSYVNGYLPCEDQADAAANGELSVWNFHPHDQTQAKNLIKWDIAGGSIDVDSPLGGADVWAHQMYVVGAPDIPPALGGSIVFFDSYLFSGQSFQIKTENQEVKLMDPTLAASASCVKIMCYYPKGERQNHILRLRTYRPSGTF